MNIRHIVDSNIHIINAVTHTYYWTTAMLGPYVYPNPNFKTSAYDVAIVCVHGTADTSGAFRKVATRLQTILPNNVSGIHLMGFDKRFLYRHAIDEYAKQLCTQLLALNLKRVFLIGHSRGGLTAAKFAFDYATPAGIEVIGLQTACTPWRGYYDYLAIWLVTMASKSVDEMRIGSEFLANINRQAIATSIPIFFINAERDWIVSPQCAYIPERCESLSTLDRHGHLSVLSSRRFITITKDAIVSAIRSWCRQKDIPIPDNAELNNRLEQPNDITFPELVAVFDDINARIDAVQKQRYLPNIREYFGDQELNDLKLLSTYFGSMIVGSRHDNYRSNTVGGFLKEFIDERYEYNNKSLHRYTEYVISFFAKPADLPNEFFKTLLKKYLSLALPKHDNILEDKTPVAVAAEVTRSITYTSTATTNKISR